MHRTLTAIVFLLALIAGGFASSLAGAQDAAPEAGKDRPLADTMGLPELAITATADGFEGVPAATAAGRYVVTLTAVPNVESGAAVEFLMLPEDVTFDDFTAMLAGPPEGETGASDATPAGGDEQAAPDWYYQTYLAGGVAADAGFTSQGILDLRPGTYVVWAAGDPEAPQAPVEMSVTGDVATPVVGGEPTAGATITMFEYGFKLDGELTTGPQVIKVANVGTQPHFAILLRPGGSVTKEQVGMVLDAELAGTPTVDAAAAAGVSNPDEWAFAEYAGTISTGATEWIAVDLEPGDYVLVCFTPDIESGLPHAYLGMYDVVTVGDEGTPTA